MKAIDHAVPGVKALTPYLPGKPISELQRELGLTKVVKLASNENPLGPSPRAVEAARRALSEIHLYPDGGGYELKAKLAEKLGVEPAMITLGNGSNDVLELIARAFLNDKASCVFSEHAFAVYPIVSQAVGANARIAKAHDGSRGPRYGHDLTALLAMVDSNTRVIFIANPNNPTRTFLKAFEIEAFLQKVPEHVVVVIDEAYNEFLTPEQQYDAIAWVRKYPNVIVSRSFSKAYGLAGLRIGYGIAQNNITDLLNRIRQPFNVNSLAQAAAIAALADSAFLKKCYDLNCAGYAQLTKAFDLMGLSYIPSSGNFVLVKVGEEPNAGAKVNLELLKAGVIVRPVGNYGLPQWLRISIGLPEENQIFIDALKKILGR